MEKIGFDVLGLVLPLDTKEVVVNGVSVQVKPYLPTEKKATLINIVLQETEDPTTGLLDKVKADALFSAYIVAMYTNIQIDPNITIDQYDILEANGVIDTIIGAIPEVEYNSLVQYYEDAISDLERYKVSMAGMIKQLITDLPVALEKINNIMADFDPSQVTEVINMARAVGGNAEAVDRLISGQE